jgi:peroxin-14
MIEKHSASQSSALAELQNELRSLKALLQSRTAPPPAMPGTSSPPSLASSTSSLPGSASVPNLTTGMSQTTAAANALLAPKGRGIPAWQKAPAPAASSPGGSRSATPAPGMNGEGEKEVKSDEAT